MAQKTLKGKFITFEGCEGSGKSTHSKLLYDYLKKKGYSLIRVREPGSTPVGEKVRKILLDPKNKISEVSELFLYMSCRSQLVEDKILPALKKGRVVICDRFLDATICYQGYAGGVDIGMIKKVGHLATSGIEPGLTIFLNIKIEEGLKRSKGRDRIERKSLKFHRRVKRGYLKLAKAYPSRIKIISTKGTIKQTQELIRRVVERCLGEK